MRLYHGERTNSGSELYHGNGSRSNPVTYTKSQSLHTACFYDFDDTDQNHPCGRQSVSNDEQRNLPAFKEKDALGQGVRSNTRNQGHGETKNSNRQMIAHLDTLYVPSLE